MKLIHILFLSFLIALGCKNQNSLQKSNNLDKNNKIYGVYYGIVPCASCSGIETILTLQKNDSFLLQTKYLVDSPIQNFENIKGSFSINDNILTLNINSKYSMPNQYKIKSNEIIQLDLEGNEIKGNLAQLYILSKSLFPEIENTKWKLIELNSKEINENPENYFIFFSSKNKEINAQAGCNILNMSYSINNPFSMKINKVSSTKMFCPNSIEDEFINALRTCDNYTTDGKFLSLNKARMAPLVRFERVN